MGIRQDIFLNSHLIKKLCWGELFNSDRNNNILKSKISFIRSFFCRDTIDMGAIGGIRSVKNVIGVARNVLENTEHSILVGSLATSFAKQLGFAVESLQTNYSKNVWSGWKKNNCQPNFWKVKVFQLLK